MWTEAESIALVRAGTVPLAVLSAEAQQKMLRGDRGDGEIGPIVAQQIAAAEDFKQHVAAEDKRVKKLLLSTGITDAEKADRAEAHWFLVGDQRRGDFLIWCYVWRHNIGPAAYGRVLADSWNRPKVGSLATRWGLGWKLVNDMFLSADQHHLMDDAEFDFFKVLPDRITVYRGSGNNVTAARAARGMSWTLDRGKAEWFAQRDGDGFCIKAEVPKRNVFAYFDGRNEQEVVIRYASVRKFEQIAEHVEADAA